MFKTNTLIILAIFLLSSGCAANPHITSKPSGAKIYVDGGYEGTTPTNIKVPDKFGLSTYVFKAEKKGYSPEKIIINEKGLEDAYKAIPQKIHFTLTKTSKTQKDVDKKPKNKVKRTSQKKEFESKLSEIFAASWRAPEETRLVAIGVSDFKDSSIPQVNYAALDAKYISSFLKSSGVPKEHLTCLTNNKATRSDIIDALMKLKMATTDSSETAIFYFSGHGAPIIKDGEIVDAALVPYDASQDGLEYTGIRISRLKEILADTQGNWIVILDACFSGKEGRSLMAKDVKSIAVVPKDYNVAPKDKSESYWLTSTSGDNFANSFEKKDHGLFTYYLVQALNGEQGVDQNKDGLITIGEAFAWTKDRVTTVSRKSLGRPQYPEMSGQGSLILTVPQ